MRFLLLLLLGAGCCRPPAQPASRVLTEADALGLARSEFKKRFPERFPYYQSSVTDDKLYGRWNVFFQPTGEYADPGAHMLVRVYKGSGLVEFEFGK